MAKVLAITVAMINDEDYAGIATSVKQATATITDGAAVSNLPELHSDDSAATDATVKTNFKTRLTAAGYTWDSEV